MISRWLKEWYASRNRKDYRRGYDYAVGALLRDECSVGYLEAMADGAFDFNMFDRGILDAIRKLEDIGFITL